MNAKKEKKDKTQYPILADGGQNDRDPNGDCCSPPPKDPPDGIA